MNSYLVFKGLSMAKRDAVILCTTFNESIEAIFSFSSKIIDDCLEIEKKYKISLVLVFEKIEYKKATELQILLSKFDKSFFQILINTQGYGFSSCLNYGIENTNSDFIFRIDSDDTLLVNRLENQIETMIKDNIDLSYGDMIDPSGNLIRYPRSLIGVYFTIALGANPIPHPTVCLRRDKIFKYDSKLKKAEDFDLWIKCFTNPSLKIENLGLPLIIYDNKRSFQKNKDNSKAQIKIRIKYIKKLFPILISLSTGLIFNLVRFIFDSSIFIRIRRNF